jgi:hypothetical protein
MNLNRVIRERIDCPFTTLNASSVGDKNPRFGPKHTEYTKNLIAAKAKERMQDPDYRELMQRTSWFKTGEVAYIGGYIMNMCPQTPLFIAHENVVIV